MLGFSRLVMVLLFVSGCASYTAGELVAAPSASPSTDTPTSPRFAADWSTPSKLHPSFDVYGSYESIQTRNLRLSDSSIGSFSADALGPRISAFTIGTHSALHLLPSLYVGFDIAIGGGDSPVAVLRTTPAVTTSRGAFHAHLGGIVGVESPHLGPLDVRGELFLGGRLYGIEIEEQQYGCTHDGCAGLFGAAWMVQPKGILEAWVAPRVTLGAFAAADVAHPGDWATGIFLGIHQHAYR